MESSSETPSTPVSATQDRHDVLDDFQFKITNNLSVLPTKLLLQIFSYLSPESLVALTESCKDLKFIVEHSMANLWPSGGNSKRVCLRGIPCFMHCFLNIYFRILRKFV